MMRTNIKDFRAKVLSIKEKISEKEFFTSSSCHAYLQALIEVVCKKYNNQIKLYVEWSDSDIVAFATDRSSLYINANNEYFHKAEGKVKKLVVLKALALHECGHLLFTDYHLAKSSKKVFLNNRKLFPEPKCSEYTDILTDFVTMNDDEIEEWYTIYHYLSNALEDGFVENMILQTLPGEGKCLELLRGIFYEGIESIKVQKSKGLPTSSILFNSILSLAKYGTVKMDADDKEEDAINELLKQFDLIKQTVHTQKSYERAKLTNELFCKFYHFLKEEEENNQNDQENQEQDAQENSDNQISSSQAEKKQNKEDSSNSSKNDGTQNNEQKGNEGTADNKSSSSVSGNSSGNKKNSGHSTRKNIINNMQAGNDIKDNIDTGTGSVLNDNNINQPDIPTERNNQDKLQNMKDNTPDSSITPDPTDIHQSDNIGTEIAESKVNEEIEKDLAKDLEEECQKMDYSSINNNIKITINRPTAPSKNAEAIYEKDMQSIRFLTKKTVDELKRKLKDRQQGGKLNGLYMGRYLDQHSLGRFDLRMLCKNDLPEDIPNMAFCIYLDTSGSMAGDKISKARQTCLLLYHIGIALNIPVMVYTHSATHGKVFLNALADFGSVDGLDKYRICDMQAYGCNRDGMGLRFCSERLSKRTEDVKLMFVISDGLPSYYNSYNEAETDIRNVLTEYSKKQVKYITVGLGEDQERIEKLYTQEMDRTIAARFLCTQNADELPVTIVETIKKIIAR